MAVTSNPENLVQVHRWGLISYAPALAQQESIFNGLIASKAADSPLPHTLIFCEHPPVYTIGRSGKLHNLLVEEAALTASGISLERIGRGGDITFHGPGQIVAYPIFDLSRFKTDIHWYLRTLEDAVIATLAHFGITAGRQEGMTGVWVGNAKICAMGVKASRWVVMHGIALNVNTDLAFFANIIPCNIPDKEVTSMAALLGTNLSLQEVEAILLQNLANCFQFTISEESNEQ